MIHAIKNRFEQTGKQLPHLFLGTDITTNFGRAPVNTSVTDLFGRTYSKIPSPLDIEHFWQPEVLDVFDQFCEVVQKIYPVTGVFFDLEMYHAQNQAGMYEEFMDFSDHAWQLYARKSNDIQASHLGTIKERVDYLLSHKKFATYFAILQKEAIDIGKKIKNHIRTKIPSAMFGAYAPFIPTSWFYRGLLAGLSSAEDPLIFTSFNTDFYSHLAWLKNQNIHLLHGPPILLSKFKTKNDFTLIDEFLRYHDFIWYNRVSRMIHQFNKAILAKQSWGVEASELPAKTVAKEIKKHTQQAYNEK